MGFNIMTVQREVREKRDRLSFLQSQHSNHKTDTALFVQLQEFQVKRQVATLPELREFIDREYTQLGKLRKFLHDNPNLETMSDFEVLYEPEKDTDIAREIRGLQAQLRATFEGYNLCPTCVGKRTVYDRSLAYGDPYARSSDCQVPCQDCGSTGSFEGFLSKGSVLTF